MKIGQAGLDLIKSFEGLELDAYLCPAGIWTIGYGSTHGVKPGDKLSDEEAAEELLKKDVVSYEAAVNNYVRVALNQNEFDALVSFCYNLGPGNLRKSTLLKKLNGLYPRKVVAEEFGKWVKANGRTLRGLVRRRRAEKRLFLKEEEA